MLIFLLYLCIRFCVDDRYEITFAFLGFYGIGVKEEGED